MLCRALRRSTARLSDLGCSFGLLLGRWSISSPRGVQIVLNPSVRHSNTFKPFDVPRKRMSMYVHYTTPHVVTPECVSQPNPNIEGFSMRLGFIWLVTRPSLMAGYAVTLTDGSGGSGSLLISPHPISTRITNCPLTDVRPEAAAGQKENKGK